MMYALADCNNFFVSCERVFNPLLNGKPVVVLSNNDGCAISRSNEAKALGIPMGCPAFKIKNYTDPSGIVMLSARHVLYQDISNRIMRILGEAAIDLEVYSVDEAFFKLPYNDDHNNHELLTILVKKIYKYVGVPVSIGFAHTRTLAKIASHVAKKNPCNVDRVMGLTQQEQIDNILKVTKVSDIWGIGRKLNAKLLKCGIHYASEFILLPKSYLHKIGNINLVRTQQELLGLDSVSINPVTIAHKSIMNSRTFGHALWQKSDISDAVLSFVQSCAAQLRREQSAAITLTVYIRGDRFREDLPFYSNSCTLRLESHTSSTIELARYALVALNNIFREGYYYRKAGVMVSDIKPVDELQLDLFNVENQVKHRKLMATIDDINKHYGSKQIMLAPTLTRGEWAPQQNHIASQSKTLRFYSGMLPRYSTRPKSIVAPEDEYNDIKDD